VFVKVFAAPKIVYQVDKLDVYANGVWAEYTIKNINQSRKYVTPVLFRIPVSGMKCWDESMQNWRVPPIPGQIQYNNPDTFIAIEPGSKIKYRTPLLGAGKPLELINDTKKIEKISRPKQLNYSIMSWTMTYTSLTESGTDKLQSTLAIGSGNVSVSWYETNCPESLRLAVRLTED
jgi:hypothetical protein